MLMTMLDAGGLPPVEGSARGSYEFLGLPFGQVVPSGRAIKLLDAVLWGDMPKTEGRWRFIWLNRRAAEQAKSQAKFMRLLMPDIELDVATLRESLNRDKPKAMRRLAKLGPVLELSYEAILIDPKHAAVRLGDFVGLPLDIDAMAAVVHHRTPTCRDDCSVEIALSHD